MVCHAMLCLRCILLCLTHARCIALNLEFCPGTLVSFASNFVIASLMLSCGCGLHQQFCLVTGKQVSTSWCVTFAGSWDPLSYVQRSQDLTSSQVPANLSTTISGKPIHEFMPYNGTKSKRGKRGRNDMYMLPVEYTSVKDGPEV